MEPVRPSRGDYRHFRAIPTRWMDNDIYGHVNNVIYYSYFDTAVNQYLVEKGVLDPYQGNIVGFVVETSCTYVKPLAFPDVVTAGVRVARIGNRSVRYEIGLFRNDEDDAAAAGHFIHVYVERTTGRSTSLPDATRIVLEGLKI